MLADIMRTEYDTDFALMNAGCLRSNSVIPKGYITMKTIMHMFPMPDNILVIKITGQTFKDALENGVSSWPRYDGRWPLLSGAKFCFNTQNPVGQRINIQDI